MKKFACLLCISLFLLTGCGSKKSNEVVCSGSIEEDDVKLGMAVTAKLKDGKVSNASVKMTFDDEDTAKEYCDLFNLANSYSEENEKISFNCSSKEIEFDDYASILSNDDDDDIIGMTKDDFVKYMIEQDLTCK
ncbi:MAG: hypothetical protein Q4E75_03000 [bacterium]|nr:hypothetical protein [bacterium]